MYDQNKLDDRQGRVREMVLAKTLCIHSVYWAFSLTLLLLILILSMPQNFKIFFVLFNELSLVVRILLKLFLLQNMFIHFTDCKILRISVMVRCYVNEELLKLFARALVLVRDFEYSVLEEWLQTFRRALR